MLSNVLVISRVVVLTCTVAVQQLRPPTEASEKKIHEKKQDAYTLADVIMRHLRGSAQNRYACCSYVEVGLQCPLEKQCIMLVISHIFRPICKDHV